MNKPLSQSEVEERAETILDRIRQTKESRSRWAVEDSISKIVESHSLLQIKTNHEAEHLGHAAGDFYIPAIGIARLCLRTGDVEGALKALDHYCDKADQAHRAACLADCHSLELVEQFLGKSDIIES